MRSEIAIFHLNSDSLIKIRTANKFQLFSMLLYIVLEQQIYSFLQIMLLIKAFVACGVTI